MKLLIVTPYFYPKIGGLENYAWNFSKELQRKFNVEIIVITANHKDKKDIIEVINGIKIYRLAPLFKVSNTPIHPLWFLKIKKIIKNEKPNVINAHTPVPFIADMASLAKMHVPFIVTYHAYSLYKYNFSFLNLIIKAYKLVENNLFRNADKIIVVSDTIIPIIPNKYKNKVIPIYNAIKQKKEIKKYSTNNNCEIIFIGNLDKTHEWKGLLELLEAISILAKQDKNVCLSVIGDGTNKKFYEDYVKKNNLEKNVTFFGKKEGKEKERYLQYAKVGIIYPKSSNDAFPTVALEYWQNKIPIIVADIKPLNSLFVDNKTAFFVEANNPVALAKAIEKVLKNETLQNELAFWGYNEFVEKYKLETQTDKLFAILQEVAK